MSEKLSNRLANLQIKLDAIIEGIQEIEKQDGLHRLLITELLGCRYVFKKLVDKAFEDDAASED